MTCFIFHTLYNFVFFIVVFLLSLYMFLTKPYLLFFQNFYKTELNKEEMYIRYIHKLYDLHLKAQNYTGRMIFLVSTGVC